MRTLLAAAVCVALAGPVVAGDFKSLMEIETEKLQAQTQKLQELGQAVAKVNAYANDSSIPIADRNVVVSEMSARMLKIINARCLDKAANNFSDCEPLYQKYIDAASNQAGRVIPLAPQSRR
jgi:uncharacterized protein (DUF3084 family)